jgi:peptide/nickel transport system permease protein
MSDNPALTPAITPAVQTRLLLPSRGSRTNVPLFLGLAILVVIAAAAIAAPLLTSWNPIEPDPVNTLLAPSGTHLLGTDNLGRDVFARILYGARSDLTIASVAVAAPFLIGLTLGIVCGYVGGWLDMVAMRVADIVTAFPFFILVISLVFVLGGGVWTIFVAITAVSWVAYARIVRAETMVLRNTEFVAACRAGGISLPRILVRHIAPNVVTQAIVFAMSDIVMNVGVIVTLSYLGLGIVPPTPDWGAMMADGQQFLAAGYFGLTLFPAAAVVLTSLALSLVGEGLAHVLRIER